MKVDISSRDNFSSQLHIGMLSIIHSLVYNMVSKSRGKIYDETTKEVMAAGREL